MKMIGDKPLTNNQSAQKFSGKLKRAANKAGFKTIGKLADAINDEVVIVKAAGLTGEDEMLQKLIEAILRLSKRGEFYDGPDTTYIGDWLEEGDPGEMTIQQLADEWDE